MNKWLRGNCILSIAKRHTYRNKCALTQTSCNPKLPPYILYLSIPNKKRTAQICAEVKLLPKPNSIFAFFFSLLINRILCAVVLSLLEIGIVKKTFGYSFDAINFYKKKKNIKTWRWMPWGKRYLVSGVCELCKRWPPNSIKCLFVFLFVAILVVFFSILEARETERDVSVCVCFVLLRT